MSLRHNYYCTIILIITIIIQKIKKGYEYTCMCKCKSGTAVMLLLQLGYYKYYNCSYNGNGFFGW